MQSHFDKAGTYGPESGQQVIKGGVTISAAGVTLRNTLIKGDLLIAKSVGEGEVTLDKVSVEGATNIKGGGANSITCRDCNLPQINIDKDGVRVVATGSTSVRLVTLASGAILVEVTLSGTGFEDVVISREVSAGSKIDLQGRFADVTVSANVNLNIGRSSSVDTLTLNSGTTVTGNGSIGTANISAKGVTIAQSPGRTVVAAGVTASVGGQTVQGSSSSTPGGSSGGSGGSSGGGSDTTPPTFAASYPAAVGISSTTLNLLIKTNENGIAYYVVLPDGSTAPSSAQVKAGQNAAGTTVAANLRGSLNLTANTQANTSITGLTVSSSYDIYVVAQDAASTPNLQTSPTRVDVTTLASLSGSINLSAASYTVNENAGIVTITVNRTGGSDGAASVNYATANGTATAGSDYTTASGTLNWADGNADAKTFTVSITDDAVVEGDETFTITLSSATGASLGAPSTATVTITDNDVAVPGSVALSSATYSVAENGGTVTITVNRTGGSDGAASVNYATANGTATAGSDYTTASGTLNWADGNADAKTFTVSITDDAVVEGDETFTITLSSATGASLVAPSTATVTITDNDVAVPISDFSNSAKTHNSATFTWTAAVGATAVKIQQSTDGGTVWSDSTTGAIAANATTATATGLNASSAYKFKLVVTGGSNAGDSNVVDVTTDAAPGPLTDFANSAKTHNSATFTWTAAVGATAVKIQQSTDGGTVWSDSTTGAIAANATTATATGLNASSAYKFKLVVTGGSNAGDSNVVDVSTKAVKAWTIMVYSDADNNLEGQLLQDIAEMKSGVTDEVNLIVLIDRQSGLEGDNTDSSILGEDFADTRLYEITPGTATRIGGGTQFPEITTVSNHEANMGDANTLKKFIEFCKANYAANQYALIPSNHGGGARGRAEAPAPSRNNNEKAVCWDDTDGGDCLYIAEISDVLNSSHSVQLLGFDACFMGTAEVAYQYRTGNGGFEANVMVASAPTEYGAGWDYMNILKRLKSGGWENTADPDTTMGGNEIDYNPLTMTPWELGGVIVEEQHDSCIAYGYGATQSLACFDLSKAANVKNAVDALAVQLATANEKADFENIRGSEGSTVTMEYFNQNDALEWIAYPYFDLYDLCYRVSNSANFEDAVKTAASSVLTAVDNMVVYSYGGTSYTDFENGKHGLSIFFPDGDRMYDADNDGSVDNSMFSYQWWYNSIDTNTWWPGGHYYGELKWCQDNQNPTVNMVGNWFEMLDSWFEEGPNDATGGYNGYQW